LGVEIGTSVLQVEQSMNALIDLIIEQPECVCLGFNAAEVKTLSSGEKVCTIPCLQG
jgi:hypothetical protein